MLNGAVAVALPLIEYHICHDPLLRQPLRGFAPSTTIRSPLTSSVTTFPLPFPALPAVLSCTQLHRSFGSGVYSDERVMSTVNEPARNTIFGNWTITLTFLTHSLPRLNAPSTTALTGPCTQAHPPP
ncbi:hypothetical protein NMY22_g185 [Coprinellus aureogranulatus]|nr:hypothetical protein NMY22_g185 [Coprinellus aureogranulatus]